MDLTPEVPASSIMLNNKWATAHSYTVKCECGSTNHDVNAWVEVDVETGSRNVELKFYIETETSGCNNFMDRVKVAWNTLVKGYYRQEHELILKEQAAVNFLAAMQGSIQQLKDVRNKNGS